MLASYRHLAKVQSKTIVHFIHIGKTGGTAIKHALGRDKPFITKQFIIFCHPHTFLLKDVLKGEKFFFVVRDPVERFVSGFYSRQRKGMPRAYHEWNAGEKTAFEIFNSPNELALALSSPDETLRKQAMQAMLSIGHVNTSFWDWFKDEGLFKSRIDDLTFIGKQASLDQDFEKLKALLGIPKHIKLPKDDVKAHKNPTSLDKSLNDAAKANLKKWYERDFEFLELLKNLPV